MSFSRSKSLSLKYRFLIFHSNQPMHTDQRGSSTFPGSCSCNVVFFQPRSLYVMDSFDYHFLACYLLIKNQLSVQFYDWCRVAAASGRMVTG